MWLVMVLQMYLAPISEHTVYVYVFCISSLMYLLVSLNLTRNLLFVLLLSIVLLPPSIFIWRRHVLIHPLPLYRFIAFVSLCRLKCISRLKADRILFSFRTDSPVYLSCSHVVQFFCCFNLQMSSTFCLGHSL